MLRMLRNGVCIGLLLSGLLFEISALDAQEPAVMNGAQAVRFEQSPGFYNYVAFCRTPKEFSAQIPAAKSPADQLEYGLCWYASGSRTGGGNAATEGADGKIVISEHHVRFIPRDPRAASLYMDLPREQVELKHESGQPQAVLQGKDVAFSFRFSKLCLSCAPGTPPTPGSAAPALLDQEFGLLNFSIQRFYPAWRQIYEMSGGKGGEPPSPAKVARSASPAAPHRAAKPVAAPAPSTSDAARAEAVPPAKPQVPVAANASSTAPSKPLATAAAKPSTVTGVRSALSGSATPYSVPNSSVGSAVKPLAPGPMVVPRLKPVKIASGAADGLLVKKIPPDYPLEAKLVRLEGTVVLHAIIDRSGEVSQVNAVSGPPLLESAAVDAVKQWQYRPYSMNGQPVDVETTVEVVFALDGSHGSRAQNARK